MLDASELSFIPGESCLNGSFRDMAVTSTDCHWKGLALRGSGEGKERAGLAGWLGAEPTYERHCLRGRRHDGRDEVHKNG